MIRTQVQLSERQVQELRRLAASTGRSVADLVRQGVDLYLSSQAQPRREERVQRAVAVVGRFSSGSPDGSVEHDRYLAEAFGE